MATIDISPAAGTPASTGYLIYTDATTGTFKKAPLSALPLSDAMVTALAAKQATLVSGTNIKTIDGSDITGSGDVTVAGGVKDPLTIHTGTTWNGTLKYRVLSADLALTLVTALQSGMILFKQDGTGGHSVSIEGEDMPINLDPGAWSSVGFVKASTEYLMLVNPTVVSLTPAVDLTPPTFLSRTAISRNTIRVVADEDITAASAAGLTASIGGGPITALSISGSGTTWDIVFPTNSFSTGDTITLSASGSNTITDTATTPNALVAFTDAAVTNTVDSVAPTLSTRTAISTTTIRIVANEAITAASAAGLTAKVNAGSPISAVSISGSGATWDIVFPSSSFTGSDTITLSASGSNTITDLATPANALAAFTDAAVTNGFATTLNAPTSFAAGTPTADGCPFTWVDANTTPAEDSHLIQITTAADTTYAAVVTTRTPAANATSAAAGTGLTASTNYRARIKAIGNGTTTLNSAYSSDVTFTTAAPALSYLAFTNRSGGVTESPTHTFNGPAGDYTVSDLQMAGNGSIEAEIGASANEIVIFGLDDTATLNNYNGTWELYVFPYSGNYHTADAATAYALHDTGIPYATGDKWGLYRVGSTIKARKDSGSGYVDVYTFTGTYSSTMNAKIAFAVGTTTIKEVKGEGFA